MSGSSWTLVRVLVYVAAGFQLTPLLLPKWYALINKANLEVSEDLQDLTQQVCRRMDVDSSKVHIYMSSNIAASTVGSLMVPEGVWIGLPFSYLAAERPSVFDDHPFTMNGRQIPWNSILGRQVKDLITPSRQAQTFAIAHELAHARAEHPLQAYSQLSLMYIGAYHLCRPLYYMTILPRTGPLRAGPLFYAGCAMKGLTLSLLSYFAVLKTSAVIGRNYEFEADDVAANQGLLYAEGGYEHLTKHFLLIQKITAAQEPLANESPGFFDRTRARISKWLQAQLTRHPSAEQRLQRLSASHDI
eukprot:Clim_evm30s251 gene=Clim_evmTU30s251